MQLLTKLNEEGMTIVFVTHDPRMAEFARRLIHIYDGKLMNDDDIKPLDETMDTPDSPHLNSETSSSR
jgi:ABC-type lipoprotein export system ATPase subunit